jgi:inosose dehydratase
MHSDDATSRRSFLGATIAAGAALAQGARCFADEPPRTIGLGCSLYGMKSLPTADALKTCAEIGYDCIELPVMPDWPADSAKLNADARREIRAQLNDSDLRLTALMENQPCSDPKSQAANLERLKRACELANDLAADNAAGKPLIETILGGRPGEFESLKGGIIERLGEWAKVLADAKATLAIKAHIGNVIQRPAQLIELLDAVASPWLKAAYDYSHFQLQDLTMDETMTLLLPRSVFVHVKDTHRADGKWRFLLPGEGEIDYADYFRLLSKSVYCGDVMVEVSGQVFNQPGYDPVAAARQCYNHLAPAMQEAGIMRG